MTKNLFLWFPKTWTPKSYKSEKVDSNKCCGIGRSCDRLNSAGCYETSDRVALPTVRDVKHSACVVMLMTHVPTVDGQIFAPSTFFGLCRTPQQNQNKSSSRTCPDKINLTNFRNSVCTARAFSNVELYCFCKCSSNIFADVSASSARLGANLEGSARSKYHDSKAC